MSVWRNDIKYNYMFMFSLKNLARKGLIGIWRAIDCVMFCVHHLPQIYDARLLCIVTVLLHHQTLPSISISYVDYIPVHIYYQCSRRKYICWKKLLHWKYLLYWYFIYHIAFLSIPQTQVQFFSGSQLQNALCDHTTTKTREYVSEWLNINVLYSVYKSYW